MVGPGLLVTPVLYERDRIVTGYFPEAYWYSIDGDDSINVINEDFGTRNPLSAPIDYINVHIRGGYIIPMQDHANTTEYARKTPFLLYVATDEFDEAAGELFYDDGESQKLENFFFARYSLRGGNISNEIETNTYDNMKNLKLDNIRIFFKRQVANFKAVWINEDLKTELGSECKKKYCEIKNLDLTMNESFTIEISYEN